MNQPKGAVDEVAKLARADLQVVREREGDSIALGHAEQVAQAAAEFIAVDLGRPEIVAKILDDMVIRLRTDHPEAKPIVVISGRGPDDLAAMLSTSTRTELHEIVRLTNLDHASAAAGETARTAMAFLVETGQIDCLRDLAAEAAREVERLNGKEG